VLQPSQVDAQYRRALADPLEQGNAALIRWVEARHGDGWRGGIVNRQEAEALTVGTLAKSIKDARAARLPDPIKNLIALIERAEAAVEKAKTFGIRSQRPFGWRAA